MASGEHQYMWTAIGMWFSLTSVKSRTLLSGYTIRVNCDTTQLNVSKTALTFPSMWNIRVTLVPPV